MSARDPLQELEDALSFPTSPDFCARVRQRVAVEPVRSRLWLSPRLAVAAGVVLAAGIGVIGTLRHPAVGVAPITGPSLAPSVRTVRSAAPDLHPARVTKRTVTVAARETVSPFETVVPDDQLHALDRLLAGMREGRSTVPPVVADSELNERGERVLRALVIEPVTVTPIKDPNK